MYKDTSYLCSKLPQVTFSKRNKHCSQFRLMEQNKTSACFIQGRTPSNPGLQSSIKFPNENLFVIHDWYKSSNVSIQDESLIFQDALDTVKN